MNEVAVQVVNALQNGAIPWKYPHNQRPEFVKLFGAFFKGPPLAGSEADYLVLDSIIKASGARILHHWRCRTPHCKRPPQDRIILPLRAVFVNEPQYRATIIHEVLHFVEQPHRAGWLGPCESQSELISECGTGLLESFLRIPPDLDVTNVNRWLSDWVMEIRNDPSFLFNAVAQAERAVLYLLDRWRRGQ